MRIIFIIAIALAISSCCSDNYIAEPKPISKHEKNAEKFHGRMNKTFNRPGVLTNKNGYFKNRI